MFYDNESLLFCQSMYNNRNIKIGILCWPLSAKINTKLLWDLRGTYWDYIIPVKKSINWRDIKNENYDFPWNLKFFRLIIEKFLKNDF